MNYLYVMDRGDARKIGFSSDPIQRKRHVASRLRLPVTLVSVFKMQSDARIAEQSVHALLNEYRIDGEWFQVSCDIAKAAIVSKGGVECEFPVAAPMKSSGTPVMMTNTELANFRRDLALGQAAFGAWLSRELGADRPYANTEVSNWETGKRPVPYSVQAAVYRYLWSKSRDS
jgi:hypothetical protein